jgi:hydroxymethylbilane synthase
MTANRHLRIATRGSLQARTQTEHVGHLLTEAGCTIELVLVATTGDRRPDVPLHTIGGQGVFVKEVQQAVLEGRADLAVHSAKDLPSTTGAGLRLAAVGRRRSPFDALVGRSLADLAPGATVATGSVRREAQLRLLRPDLLFTGLRGNISTRLGKVPADGAIVMAAAALEWLGQSAAAAYVFPLDEMVPQVGQGALAVECRVADDDMAAVVAAVVDHEPSHRAVAAERAFLAELGSGCNLPVGAHAVLLDDARVELHTFIAGDGRHHRDVLVGDADGATEWARGAARAARNAVAP